jgi:hypothetical protein
MSTHSERKYPEKGIPENETKSPDERRGEGAPAYFLSQGCGEWEFSINSFADGDRTTHLRTSFTELSAKLIQKPLLSVFEAGVRVRMQNEQ